MRGLVRGLAVAVSLAGSACGPEAMRHAEGQARGVECATLPSVELVTAAVPPFRGWLLGVGADVLWAAESTLTGIRSSARRAEPPFEVIGEFELPAEEPLGVVLDSGVLLLVHSGTESRAEARSSSGEVQWTWRGPPADRVLHTVLDDGVLLMGEAESPWIVRLASADGRERWRLSIGTEDLLAPLPNMGIARDLSQEVPRSIDVDLVDGRVGVPRDVEVAAVWTGVWMEVGGANVRVIRTATGAWAARSDETLVGAVPNEMAGLDVVVASLGATPSLRFLDETTGRFRRCISVPASAYLYSVGNRVAMRTGDGALQLLDRRRWLALPVTALQGGRVIWHSFDEIDGHFFFTVDSDGERHTVVAWPPEGQ